MQIVNESVVPRLEELEPRAGLQSRAAAEALPQRHRGAVHLPGGDRFPDHREILRARRRPARRGNRRSSRCASTSTARSPRICSATSARRTTSTSCRTCNDYTFYQPDVEGKSQIEQSMDKYLRGKPGMRVMQRNVKGVIEGEVRTRAAASRATTSTSRSTRASSTSSSRRCASRCSAAPPRWWSIRTTATSSPWRRSRPSIRMFSSRASREEDWKKLNDDETDPAGQPRRQRLPAGLDFQDRHRARPGCAKAPRRTRISIAPAASHTATTTSNAGSRRKAARTARSASPDALKVSCDCFFYQYGNAAGIETIDHVGKILGIGQKYDIGLSDEKDGMHARARMDEDDSTRARNGRPRYTANVSIGQGYVLASPLQMAMAYATVANGGIAYEPRLVQTVLNTRRQAGAR